MYDVIVIGGWTAGSSAARKASSLGLETLLIEKETFPRYKPCGGAVSDVVFSYLDFQKVTYKDLLKWLFPKLPGYLFRHVLKKLSYLVGRW